ncbi:MAG TPA: MoaD/ThiS family protein [Burkholderiaceae bacterium]|nr:MoaD/ThiS family protein [Burkholderiaceae bacterium]
MQITLKLYAQLTDFLPAGATQNKVDLDVPEGTTIAGLLQSLNLPSKLVHLVLVNGLFVPADARSRQALRTGDALAVWPPVAGG